MNISIGKKKPRVDPQAFVAPNATLIGDVVIGFQSSIWFGSVLRADTNRISIGKGSNIQDLSVLHVDKKHSLSIGDGVTVGHRALLHGCCIEDHVLVGMGAIIMNGAEIGEESLIAAGSLVTEGMCIPPRSLVMGLPAKVRRELKAKEILSIHVNAEHYVKQARGYHALPALSKNDR